MAMAGTSVVEVVELAGRGRGLVTTQPVRAGKTLLQESPFLVYVNAAGALAFCGTCLRSCASIPCVACRSATFCSSACTSSHSDLLCGGLVLIASSGLDSDSQDQARFLLAAYHLALVSPAEFERLLLLEGDGEADEEHVVGELLQGFVEKAICGWPWQPGQREPSVELTASLLVKDARNAFGLMAPSDSVGQRSVRGFALYPTASFINHDCLPNCCRFDYVDRPGDSNLDICIRTLHDISEKVEVTMSYFPINWSFKERQTRLADEYGFRCICERCNIEQDWREDEDEGEDEDSELALSDGEESDKQTQKLNSSCGDLFDSDKVTVNAEADPAEEDDFKHAMFFVKYLCPVEECGGTMAPLLPDASDSDKAISGSDLEKDLFLSMECNVCGDMRTGEEFCKDLHEHGMLG